VLTTEDVAQMVGEGVPGVAVVIAQALAFFEVGHSAARDRLIPKDR